jgi:hypothetical protein
MGAKGAKSAPKNKTFIFMENLRYNLDKGSKKFICPKCNHRTFVLYVDKETGNYLPDDFGWCDRATNCHYHNAPPKGKKAYNIPFLSLKSISEKAYKLTDSNGIISIIPKSQILEQAKNNCWITEWFLKDSLTLYLSNESKYFITDEIGFINVVTSKEPPPKLPPSFHSLEQLDEMYIKNAQIDNLTEFLLTKFSKEEVFTVIQKFFITGTNHFWKNANAFFQIDEKGQIRGCKIMLFDKNTGRRIKKPYNHINWLHIAIKAPNFILNQCLFGLHQIIEDYQKIIVIVESERTAIIMSILLPDYIWLATGSCGNFNLKMLNPIKNRSIIAYPDKGEYNNWLNKSKELNAMGFKIAVSDLIENSDYPKGTDLADIKIDELQTNSKAVTEKTISYIEKFPEKNDGEFSEGSHEVHRMVQERKSHGLEITELEIKVMESQKLDMTKEESYKAIQYYIDNDTDIYRVQ